MSDFLPERFTRSELARIPSTRMALAARRAERELAEYELRTTVAAYKEQTDSRVLGDVMTTALDEEMNLVEYGLRRAGDNPVKQALVLQKVGKFADINNRRIERRFG